MTGYRIAGGAKPPPEPLAQPLPRITAKALAEADRTGEMILHSVIHEAEKARNGQGLNRYGVLVCAWNRCSQLERERFIRALCANAETPAEPHDRGMRVTGGMGNER
jgi:hypothetical protein